MMLQESELVSTRGAHPPQLHPELQHGTQGRNVGAVERVLSVAVGLAMVGHGLRRRTLPSMLVALVGGSILHRGVTGRSRLYAAMGLTPTRGEAGVRFELSTTILQPRDVLYRAWRDFESHPRFLPHLRSVRMLEDGKSLWVAQGPGGTHFEWTSQVTEDREGERLAWHTLPGSCLHHEGVITFEDAPAHRGTVVHLALRYHVPGGRLSVLLAKLLGEEPKQELSEGLRRFKQLQETGEVATVKAQPAGRRSLLGRSVESHPLFKGARS
jgi:uncharacterized membrane protein